MSKWRRIAIEAIPSCKITIEKATTQNRMWVYLWDEFHSALTQSPQKTETLRQIYLFASRCHKGLETITLKQSVWLFFEYLIGSYIVGNAQVAAYLFDQMSASEFDAYINGQTYLYSAERIREAKNCFKNGKVCTVTFSK